MSQFVFQSGDANTFGGISTLHEWKWEKFKIIPRPSLITADSSLKLSIHALPQRRIMPHFAVNILNFLCNMFGNFTHMHYCSPLAQLTFTTCFTLTSFPPKNLFSYTQVSHRWWCGQNCTMICWLIKDTQSYLKYIIPKVIHVYSS